MPDIASLRRDFIGTPNPFSAERRLRVSHGLRLRVPLARLRQREKRRRVRAKENRRGSDRYQVKDWGDGSSEGRPMKEEAKEIKAAKVEKIVTLKLPFVSYLFKYRALVGKGRIAPRVIKFL